MTLEIRNAHVTDVLGERIMTHAFQWDHVPLDLERQGFVLPFPCYCQLDLSPFGSADIFHGVQESHAFGRLLLDFDNHVSRFYTGLIRGCSFNGRNNGENIILNGDFNPHPGKTPLGLGHQFLILVLRHERGMRVKAVDHSLDRTVNKFLGVFRLHVVLFNLPEYFGEEFNILVNVVRTRLCLLAIAVQRQ